MLGIGAGNLRRFLPVLPLKHIAPRPQKAGRRKASDAVSVKIGGAGLAGASPAARWYAESKIQPLPQPGLKNRLERGNGQHQQRRGHIQLRWPAGAGAPLQHFRTLILLRNHSIGRPVRQSQAKSLKRLMASSARRSGIPLVCDADGAVLMGLGGIMGGGERKSPFPRKMC